MSLEWGNKAAAEKKGGRLRSDPSVKPAVSKKYDDAKSRINSGSTVAKLKAKSARAIALQRGEEFFRITPGELFDLLEEYEQADADEDIRANSYEGADRDFNPRVVVHEAEARATVDRPYLILDVREEAEFRDNHLVQAKSFPQRLLMQDKSTAELVRFKNAEGKLVVLYDDAPGQRLACAAAQVLVSQRGFGNVYVLSGGLTAFAQRHAAFVEGSWHSRENAPSTGQQQGSQQGGGSITSLLAKGGDKDGRLGTSGGRSALGQSDQLSSSSAAAAAASALRDKCQPSLSNGGGHQTGRPFQSSHGSQLAPMTGRSSGGNGGKLPGLSGHGGGGGGYSSGGQLQSLRMDSMRRNQQPESGGGRFDEEDERASRMSGVSVAESIMSKAQNRKQALSGSRAHYR